MTEGTDDMAIYLVVVTSHLPNGSFKETSNIIPRCEPIRVLAFPIWGMHNLQHIFVVVIIFLPIFVNEGTMRVS